MTKRARLDKDGTAKGKVQIFAHYTPNGQCIAPGFNAESYTVRIRNKEDHEYDKEEEKYEDEVDSLSHQNRRMRRAERLREKEDAEDME